VLTATLVAIILLALLFDYTNGFHDAANAIASAVSTRALTPRTALVIAAVGNLVGALLSTGVAVTVAKSIIDPPVGLDGMAVVLAALVGAIIWNFTTWYFGLPSSSSQALIGGLVGAALASGSTVYWSTGVVGKVLIPMILSPTVGFLGGYLLMIIALWSLRNANPHRVDRGFRIGQIFSAAAMSLGHGLQDAQKSMGIIVLALVTAGLSTGLYGATVGRPGLRLGIGSRHVLRWLANYAYAGPAHLPIASSARLCRRDHSIRRALYHRVCDCRAYLDNPGDHGLGDGSRHHPAAVSRTVGGGP
jgi:phosphate/sulfate permease